MTEINYIRQQVNGKGHTYAEVFLIIKLVGCWAHARRKFTDALRALTESASNSAVKAKEGLEFCND